MSFDGSFSCDAALRRFLARCPDLQPHPRLAALAHKGGALTADDVVDVIADPFLHTSYTIPIMGCFRPLNRQIVGRAVARLRLVPSLNLETVGAYEEIGDDDPLVIDFYLRRGRTLRLHELASLAFCRALDLAPFLLKYVLSYFNFSPPPFGRLAMEVAPQFIEKDVKYLLYAVRASYRLLLMEPKVFSELWDWSCFLDLVERIAAFDFGDAAAKWNDILDIRWCGIQILSVILKISDRATQNFGMGMDEAFLCLLRWEEFCMDTSLEKVGLYCQATEMENTISLDGIVNFSYCLESFDNKSSSISHSNSDEVVLERRKRKNKVSGDLRLLGNPFILTSTLKKSFEMVMMAVSQKWPILLHGPAGAGKTALINYLADISGNQVLFIHMDEQMDSKTLIGTYICTEQPGEFRWQPGSLTQALLNGLWVVFEDIDKAPNEVHSIILPLLEGSSSFATGHGEWFSQLQKGRILTVRDLVNWISFINETEGSLGPAYAFIHGVFLVLLDGLSLGTDISKTDVKKLREAAYSFLLEEIKVADNRLDISCLSKMENYGWGDAMEHADTLYSNDSTNIFGIKPFYFNNGCNDCRQDGFEFLAPTICRNALRVLRAMQLPKPVLLEGSPGVGKTSLVVALAEYSGHTVVRINLSEQTDMMDLLGSDLPFEGDNGIECCWSDGILLQALKNGSWVLLDELNLAPQSVLEGLNSILDHRAEIFIPELGQTYKCPDSFRVFACQNPSCQGGGRKGLPKSLLNCFTKVYVDELSAEDYLSICQSRHPIIPEELLLKLISFNRRLYEDTMISRIYGQEGSPWEFNLRDVIRSCQIIEDAPKEGKLDSFLTTVYLQRMRTADDRKEVLKLFESVFGVKPYITQSPHFHISPQYLIVGSACVGRSHYQPIKISKGQLNMLPGIFHNLEAAVRCIQQRWLCILVGPSSSGKTSLIRLLAQLTGNALNELNLSSGTDVSELLGCFEQYNHYRIFKIVASQVERFVDEYFSLRLEMEWKGLIIGRKSLFAKWFGFLATKMSMHAFEESYRSGFCSALLPLIEIIEQLKDDLEKFRLPMSWSYEHLNNALKTVLDLQKSKIMQPSAKFEWVTSNLIKAVEYGEWVVLDNANLCNPTVLDRINSLVEPEGSIMLNECGLVDGKPVKLNAHPNFRLFLTVDPKHGEVSRAMRNRGVEIFMMQPNWLPNGEGYNACQDNDVLLFTADAKHSEVSRVMLDGGPEMYLSEPKWQVSDEGHRVFEDSEFNDVKWFLILSGIPIIKMVMTMTDAHMNAKSAGLRLGLCITLLELGRWVQLFQLLLISGNQPKWSLQLSWEHTYMSLLGEFEGCDTVMQALSDSELYNLNPLLGCSLSLPGGWPVPHTLRNFMLYSREACVKRNCMYLEFLGGQCASYELRSTWNFPLNRTMKVPPSTIAKDILYNFLFPSTLDLHKSSELAKFDWALANQMLFIAANWTIEQATESDLALYIQWFKWYSSQLQPYCCFFKSFLMILEQERDHPIWNYILDCRRELLSYYKIDVNVRPLPLLSSNLAEMGCLDGSLKKCKEHLENALHCVSLLRLTYQQWNSEKDYVSSALSSLRCLEREALKEIVESQDILQIYSNILEHHIFFWKLARHGDQILDGKGITSSQFDYMLITWSCIKKEAAKLQPVFPKAVGELLEQDLNLGNSLAWSPHNGKPTLWVHGGHPFLPSSANIYHKVQQLLSFCNEIWPRNIHMKVNAILSTNAGLRHLAVQGLCLSYIATGSDEDDANIVHQLEEIYQGLSKMKVKAWILCLK